MSAEANPLASLAGELDFTTYGYEASRGFLDSEKHVWCNWCQCEVRPQLFALRQHRHACTTDPRVAGD